MLSLKDIELINGLVECGYIEITSLGYASITAELDLMDTELDEEITKLHCEKIKIRDVWPTAPNK